MVVVHHWDWRQYPDNHLQIKTYEDEVLAMLILAGDDPRLHNTPHICKCSRIGRWRCKECLGTGRWYYGKG